MNPFLDWLMSLLPYAKNAAEFAIIGFILGWPIVKWGFSKLGTGKISLPSILSSTSDERPKVNAALITISDAVPDTDKEGREAIGKLTKYGVLRAEAK